MAKAGFRQLWFAEQIKADYGVTNVFADAWSAPAFMKTNDSADNGGTLCGVPSATCSSGDYRKALPPARKYRSTI